MKKVMKRSLAIILVLLVALAATGCSGKNSYISEKKALLVVSFGSSFIEKQGSRSDRYTEKWSPLPPRTMIFTGAFTSQTHY